MRGESEVGVLSPGLVLMYRSLWSSTVSPFPLQAGFDVELGGPPAGTVSYKSDVLGGWVAAVRPNIPVKEASPGASALPTNPSPPSRAKRSRGDAPAIGVIKK